MVNELATTIDALREKRACLDRERDEVNAMITSAERLQTYLGRNGSTKPKAVPAKNGDTIIGTAVRILRQRGSMKTKQLLTEMAQHGFKVGGKKPIVTLYSSLTRSHEVSRQKSGAWVVKNA